MADKHRNAYFSKLGALVSDKLLGGAEVFLADPTIVLDFLDGDVQAVGVDQVTSQRVAVLGLEWKERI